MVDAGIAVLVRTRERHARRQLDGAITRHFNLHAVGVELGASNGILVKGCVAFVKSDQLSPDEVTVFWSADRPLDQIMLDTHGPALSPAGTRMCMSPLLALRSEVIAHFPGSNCFGGSS